VQILDSLWAASPAVARLRIHQDVVADLEPQLCGAIGDDADLFLVGAQRDHRALVVELFLEDDDVTLDLVAGGLDDVNPSLRTSS